MENLINVLPNLSIGVVSTLGLVYVVIRFNVTLDERADKHEKAMKEREDALRDVEKSVRENILDYLSANTIALQENTKVMSRVIRHLDGDKH